MAIAIMKPARGIIAYLYGKPFMPDNRDLKPELCARTRLGIRRAANGRSALSILIAAVPLRNGSAKASMRGEQAAFAGEVHQCLLQFLEGADLDLANALAADVVDLAQFLERLGFVGQAPLGQDVLLAVVQRLHRLDQQLVADPRLLGSGDALVLERFGVDTPILPLAVPSLAQRDVHRGVSAH